MKLSHRRGNISAQQAEVKMLSLVVRGMQIEVIIWETFPIRLAKFKMPWQFPKKVKENWFLCCWWKLQQLFSTYSSSIKFKYVFLFTDLILRISFIETKTPILKNIGIKVFNATLLVMARNRQETQINLNGHCSGND